MMYILALHCQAALNDDRQIPANKSEVICMHYLREKSSVHSHGMWL